MSAFRDWAQSAITRIENELEQRGFPQDWWRTIPIRDETYLSDFAAAADSVAFTPGAWLKAVDWPRFRELIERYGRERVSGEPALAEGIMLAVQAAALAWALRGDEPERLFAAGRLYAGAEAYLSAAVLGQGASTLARWGNDPKRGFWQWADAAYADHLARGLKANHAAHLLWRSPEWKARAEAAGVACTWKSARTTLQRRHAKSSD